MKIKIFTGNNAQTVEDEVNEFLRVNTDIVVKNITHRVNEKGILILIEYTDAY